MTVVNKDLESVLIHLSNALPFTPKWVGVISVDGIYTGYYGDFVTLALNDVAVVGINFDQVTAFDKLLLALPQALSPLLGLLKLKQ